MTKETSMTLQDALRLTPYVDGRHYGVTEEEFLNSGLYCDTYFEARIEEIKKQLELIKKASEEEYWTVSDDYLWELKELEKQNKEKQKFEDRIEQGYQYVEPRLMYIRGYSGSGKSTYLGKLLYTFKSKHNLVLKIDLVTSSGKDKVMLFDSSEKWYNAYFRKLAIAKLLSLVLVEIVKRLEKPKEMTEKQYIAFVKEWVDFFDTIETEEFENIKDQFLWFVRETENLDNDQDIAPIRKQLYKKLYESLCKLFKLYLIEEVRGNYNENIDPIKAKVEYSTDSALDFLFLLLWKEQINNRKLYPDSKYIVAIDSLEHFIDKDKVFDSDITDVHNLLTQFIYAQKQNALDRFNLPFYDNFRIIVACRDTTAQMFNFTAENNDADSYTVNVSDWFLPIEIAQLRINYFNKKIQDDISKEAILKILGDDASLYGLYTKLSTMHNQNKRRMFDYLTDVIEANNKTKEYLMLRQKFEQYNQAGDVDLRELYQHASRNFIIGLLFAEIQNVGFFDRISLAPGDNAPGLYYARRILTFLNAQQSSYVDTDGVGNFVSFYSLLNGAFQEPGTHLSRSEISKIAGVISEMDNSDKEKTHWCQLVVVKFNEENYDKTLLTEKMCEIYESRSTDTRNYGLKITNAGRFLLRKMADFEYFSVRCTPPQNYKPLFSGAADDIHAMAFRPQTIVRVKKRAFECIDKIVDEDNKFFVAPHPREIDYSLMYSDTGNNGYLYTTIKGNRKITHVESIINSHISYLESYRHHQLESSDISDDNKKKRSLFILSVIKEYIDKLRQLLQLKSEVLGNECWYITGPVSPEGYYSQENKDFLYYFDTHWKLAFHEPTNRNIWIRKNKVKGINYDDVV